MPERELRPTRCRYLFPFVRRDGLASSTRCGAMFPPRGPPTTTLVPQVLPRAARDSWWRARTSMPKFDCGRGSRHYPWLLPVDDNRHAFAVDEPDLQHGATSRTPCSRIRILPPQKFGVPGLAHLLVLCLQRHDAIRPNLPSGRTWPPGSATAPPPPYQMQIHWRRRRRPDLQSTLTTISTRMNTAQ
jgi:hypothetical protein